MVLKPAPIQDLLNELKKVKSAIRDISRWASAEIVGDDIFPPELPKRLDDFLRLADNHCESIRSKLRAIEDEETRLLLQIITKVQRGEKLSEEEYYICRAIGDAPVRDLRETEYEIYLKGFSRTVGQSD